MPDLSTIYPNTAPAEGAFAGYVQGQQMLNAQANQESNQRAALQDYLFKQQKNPIDLEQARANVPHTQALTRQSNAQADAIDLANQWENRTKDAKYQAFVDKAANDHDEADIKKTMLGAQKLMWSTNPDPEVRKQEIQRGKMIYDMSMDTLAAKDKAAAAYRQAMDVANTNGQYRVKAKTAGMGGVKTAKTLDEQYNKYMDIYNDPESSEEDRNNAKLFAEHVMQQIIAKQNAKAPAIAMDANGRVVMNPNVPRPAPLPAPRGAPVPGPAASTPPGPLNLDNYKKP